MPKWLDYSNQEIEANNIIKTKYNYDLKINNIELYENKYDDTSIFVSKPYKFTSLINNIKLDTDEYIPEGTSIEYYISLAETPTLDDWIPIASNDNRDIKNERLFFNDTHQAILRFKGNINNVVVKRDGVVIDDSAINLGTNLNNENVLYLEAIDYQAMYTVDYTIETSIVSVNKKDLIIKQIIEEFNALDDQRKISLTYDAITDENGTIDVMIDSVNGLPGFIAYEDDTEIEKCKFRKITVDGADYLYPNGEIVERTTNNFPRLLDCSSRLKDSFKFYDFNPYLPNDYVGTSMKSHYPYIEYFINDNNIYFAENANLFNQTTLLKFYARYDYVDTPLRFKVVLRNNTTQSDITPILNSYKITLI